MKADVKTLAKEGFDIRYLDVDQYPKLADKYKVKALPTTVRTELKRSSIGQMTLKELRAFCN